jgi:hypothetical protein
MISLDHNHHPSSPQNTKQNNIIKEHDILDWGTINPDEGGDFFSNTLGDGLAEFDPSEFLNDDPIGFPNTADTNSRPPSPGKPNDGTEGLSPARDRSSSLSPPPEEAVSETAGPPLTGSTLTGEENEEGENEEPRREEEEEDEEENGESKISAGGRQGSNEGSSGQSHLNVEPENAESPLSELSPPPDQDDDEPSKSTQDEGKNQSSPAMRPRGTGRLDIRMFQSHV